MLSELTQSLHKTMAGIIIVLYNAMCDVIASLRSAPSAVSETYDAFERHGPLEWICGSRSFRYCSDPAESQ